MHIDPEKVLKQVLASKGLKFTRQRKLILDDLLQSKKHRGPEEIYKTLSKRDKSLGRATLFRTLNLLVESGFANRISYDGKRQGYEFKFGRPHHDHMICVQCGRVVEFSHDTIERLQNRLAKQYGFNLLWHHHEIFGHCRRCGGKEGGPPVSN